MRSACVETTLAALACSLLFACASAPSPSARDLADANDTGRRLNTSNAADAALLGQLSAWPDGATRRLGDATVIAQASYFAASGQTCRAVHLTPGQGRVSVDRLACCEGQKWFFVPDVFGGEGALR